MKKFLVLSLVSLVLVGCGWYGESDNLDGETSMMVDNGEVAVWYTDANYNISLLLPDEMQEYESKVENMDGENPYGTIEVVTFMLDGEDVASLNVHQRSMIEANLDNVVYAERESDSRYLYTFTNLLSGDSELAEQLSEIAFDISSYLTFE